jgi:hypothetical protein
MGRVGRLPLGQALLIAQHGFSGQLALLGDGDKAKVHMGRCLVHMHHGGDDILFSDTRRNKVQRRRKIGPLLRR